MQYKLLEVLTLYPIIDFAETNKSIILIGPQAFLFIDFTLSFSDLTLDKSIEIEEPYF